MVTDRTLFVYLYCLLSPMHFYSHNLNCLSFLNTQKYNKASISVLKENGVIVN